MPELTDRQLDALRLVHRGYRNKDIAKALNLTPVAVARLLDRTYTRLGIDRAQNRRVVATLWMNFYQAVNPGS